MRTQNSYKTLGNRVGFTKAGSGKLTQKQLKQKVEKYLRKWVPKLNLTQLNFKVTFADDEWEINEGETARASMDTLLPMNNDVDLVFYPCMVHRPDLVEWVVVHELVHVLTHMVYRLGLKLLEGELVTKRELREANEGLVEGIVKVLVEGGER